MKLVIEIDDDTYKQAKLICGFFGNVGGYKAINAIANGTPLPKNHGRLIDAEVFASNVVKYSHQSTKTIGQALADAPTIIERADTCENNIFSKRKKFYIHDMDITFDTELTQEEMEQRFFSALRSIGVIGHRGCPN